MRVFACSIVSNRNFSEQVHVNADSLPLPVRTPKAARVRGFAAAMKRLTDAALPGQCAFCGNLSQGVLCDGCDAQYWNEPRLRCATCALPLPSSLLRREREDVRLHCAACLETPRAICTPLSRTAACPCPM